MIGDRRSGGAGLRAGRRDRSAVGDRGPNDLGRFGARLRARDGVGHQLEPRRVARIGATNVGIATHYHAPPDGPESPKLITVADRTSRMASSWRRTASGTLASSEIAASALPPCVIRA